MDPNFKSFFSQFERVFNDLDVKRQAEMFDDSLMTAEPKGVAARSKEEFLVMAEQLAAYYRARAKRPPASWKPRNPPSVRITAWLTSYGVPRSKMAIASFNTMCPTSCAKREKGLNRDVHRP